MTDTELNEAVARKLGHGANGTDCHGYVGIRDLKTGKERRIWPPADYCTDIEAAWEIFGWLQAMNQYQRVTLTLVDGKWGCKLGVEPVICEIADTVPRAICEAFLKLP